MSQLQRTRRSSESPKTPRAQTSPTFEQLLRVEDAYWSTNTSPKSGMNFDQVENISPTRNKKSVLMKVKERAIKLGHSLSGKKRNGIGQPSDNSSTPSWGVSLDDDDDNNGLDDAEYLGAPMYESEAAPENLKETARQHPRAVPVVSEKHLTPKISRSEAADNPPTSPNKTITETVSEKLAPAYAKVSDATHTIASKIAGLTVTTPEAKQATANNPTLFQETAKSTGDITVSPHGGNTVHKLEDNSCEIKQSSPQKWDKGISVKEYFMNKLEPREDERALSQAITDAISPRANAGDNTGVVDKVKDAVTSLFWHEEPSNSMAKATSSSSLVPSSSNISTANANNHTTNILPNGNANNRTTNNLPTATANIRMPSTNSRFSEVSKPAAANPSPRFINSHEVVEEENHGRILQAN